MSLKFQFIVNLGMVQSSKGSEFHTSHSVTTMELSPHAVKFFSGICGRCCLLKV